MPKIALFFPKYFDDPCWAGSSFSLDAPDGSSAHGRAGEWVIGRLPTCDITVALQSVSRRHCALSYSYAADRWNITDLGSKNGTRLNGSLIKPGDPYPVAIGDKLHLGPNAIHLVENEESTEEIGGPTTIAGLEPLNYQSGEPLATADAEQQTPSTTPKTLGDALYLGAGWIMSPTTKTGMAYRLIVLALAAVVAVLILGGSAAGGPLL